MQSTDADVIFAADALREEANRVRARFNNELAYAIVSMAFGQE